MATKSHYELDYTLEEQKCIVKLIDEGKLEMMVFTIGRLYCERGMRILELTTRMGVAEATVRTMLKFYMEIYPFTDPGQQITFPARRAIQFLLGLKYSNQAIGYFIGKSGEAVARKSGETRTGATVTTQNWPSKCATAGNTVQNRSRAGIPKNRNS